MELILTDEQRLLQDSVSKHLAQAGGVKRARGLRGKDAGFDASAHRRMADEGWTGILVPQDQGGLGLGLTELALLQMEVGRALAPEPIGAMAAVARSIAVDGGADAAGLLLPDLLAGSRVIMPAIDGVDGGLRLRGEGAATALSGKATAVPAPAACNGFLVGAVGNAGGPVLFHVPRDAKGLTIEQRATVDGRPIGDLTFDNVAGGQLIARNNAAAQRRLYDLLCFSAAAELVGVMSAALDITVEYLKTRKQFGRPIGSFQALQHRAVDDFARIISARSFLFQVAGQDGELASSMASALKAHCGGEALKVAKSAIQMHGAIGFTDEHDIGLYLKRAMWLNAWLGNEAHHRRRFAATS